MKGKAVLFTVKTTNTLQLSKIVEETQNQILSMDTTRETTEITAFYNLFCSVFTTELLIQKSSPNFGLKISHNKNVK